MPRRNSYSDDFSGQADRGIRSLLEDASGDERIVRLKKLLLDVIKNELTARQKQIIVLYYYKDMDTVRIAAQLGITPQAVSGVLARARLRMFRILRYYL